MGSSRRVYTEPYTRVMSADRMLRVSDRTHAGFREEARRRGVTIDEVAAAALRALRQREMGAQLAEQLTDDEVEWLDAPLG
jgi:metallophosphoesterase superfamily enzyme